MYNEYLEEACVCLECRNCRGKTTVPALKVIPGVKCKYCNEELELNEYAAVLKRLMIFVAAHRKFARAD